jgi:hypothetical protein
MPSAANLQIIGDQFTVDFAVYRGFSRCIDRAGEDYTIANE